MTPLEIDPEELEVYLEEVTELLQILEEDIIKLEKQPDNPSILQEIFRSAHTLKGSSAAMGFNVMAGLAHSMESIFDGVRSGKIPVTMRLIDVFLQCTDVIQSLKDEISDDQKEKTKVQEHIDALKTLKSGEGERPVVKADEPEPETVEDAGEEEVKEDDKTVGVNCKLSLRIESIAGCAMPYVRALQTLTFLSEIGEIEDSQPTLKEIDNEEVSAFPLSITLQTTKGKEGVKKSLAPISDIIISEILAEGEEPQQKQQPVEAKEDAGGKEDASAISAAQDVEEGEAEQSDAPLIPSPVANGSVKKYTSRTVRVDVERMDAIMDLVGELVISRTRLTQLSRNLEAYYETDDDVGSLNETADNIELISAQLQENIMKARLLPIENVFNKFPRMVRDLARKSGKNVDLIIRGEDTELDRSVIEEIGDPLMHTIRNSLDHGLEGEDERKKAGKPAQGKLMISASHVEDHIQIVVEDDGRGVRLDKVLEKARKLNLAPPDVLDSLKDDEILELIFTPGFSTAETVSEVSGRGVGMDVVRTNIEKLNGNISLESKTGEGTKTLIKLPLTLAIVKALLVNVEERIFAIPLVSVLRTLRTEGDEIRTVKGKETILFHQSVLPIVSLEDVFEIHRSRPEPEKFFVVVISWGGKRVGIKVDSLIGDQEIVIRPLGEYVGEVPGISGAAILGDGRISLIVDIDGFIRLRRREMELARSGH